MKWFKDHTADHYYRKGQKIQSASCSYLANIKKQQLTWNCSIIPVFPQILRYTTCTKIYSAHQIDAHNSKVIGTKALDAVLTRMECRWLHGFVNKKSSAFERWQRLTWLDSWRVLSMNYQSSPDLPIIHCNKGYTADYCMHGSPVTVAAAYPQSTFNGVQLAVASAEPRHMRPNDCRRNLDV